MKFETIILAMVMLTTAVATPAAADHSCGQWLGPRVAEFCERYTDHGDADYEGARVGDCTDIDL